MPRLKSCGRCRKVLQQGERCDCQPATFTQHEQSAARRGYDRWWTEYSEHYRRQHPYCVACEAAGYVTPACVVDHIIPFHVNGAIDERLRRDPANHQPLCDHRYRDCHNRLKKPLELKYRGEPQRIKVEWERLLDELRMESNVTR